MVEQFISYIDKINQAYDFISLIITVLRFFVVVLTFIGLFNLKRIKEVIRRWALHHLLGLKKELPIEVILPTFKGNMDYTPEELINNKEKVKIPIVDYVFFYETESILYLQKLLNEYHIKKSVILKTSSDTFSCSSNKIVIGGPLNNIYLHDLFSANKNGIYSFDGRFKFGVKEFWTNREKNKSFMDIEEELPSDEKGWKLFYWDKKGNRHFVTFNNSYIILIKLNKNDLKISNSGPMLICFGDCALTTNKAMKCFTESLYELCKCIKNKKHFFVIFPCTSHGDVLFSEKDIIDLTSIMLD